MILEDERKLSEECSGWRRAGMWRFIHHVDLGPAGYRQTPNTGPDSLTIIRRLRKESEIILSAPQSLRVPGRPLNYQMLGNNRTLADLLDRYGSVPLTSIPFLEKGATFKRIPF